MTKFDFSIIEGVRLSQGEHGSPEEGLCFMEAVAWFEGERHSDRPECACPVLREYGIDLNDRMPDDERNALLLPLVPLIAGTRDPANEQRRAEFLAMWTVNRVLPLALRKVGIDPTDCENARTLKDACWAAAAWAAPAAAGEAEEAVMWAARAPVGSNAWSVAVDAAYAACSTAKLDPRAWSVGVEGLRQAILLGRHDGFTVPDDVLSTRLARLREIA